MILSIQQYSHHDSLIDTAICYVTRLLLIQQSSCYDSRQTAIPQLRYSYWYRNLPCFSAPIVTTIPMQDFCAATSTAIPHYDPHTDTTICYDTKPLIIQKSICYDTIITAKLPTRYSHWDSNLPYYYSLPNAATSLLWSYRYNNTPTIIPISKQQYAMLRFSHYYSNLLWFFRYAATTILINTAIS